MVKQESQVEAREKALKELEAYNREQMARFERERAEMLEKLKTAESVAQQYERMPGWVKKMFGT